MSQATVELQEAPQPKDPPRFRARKAGPEWKAWKELAWNCERVGLTEFQAHVALRASILGNVELVAEELEMSPSRTRDLVNKIARKLGIATEFERRKREYWREMFEAIRPQRGGEAPAPVVGLLPYVDTENHPNWRSYLETIRNPRNYRTTSLRGQAANEHDIEMDGALLLHELR